MPARVARLPKMSGLPPAGARTVPTIRTVMRWPPEMSG